MSAATTTDRSRLTALLDELAAGAPVAVGVDLTHIPSVGERLARLGPRWLGDQFTERELRELDGVRNGSHATLAGRLAAKEAFIKLLTPRTTSSCTATSRSCVRPAGRLWSTRTAAPSPRPDAGHSPPGR